MSEIVKDTVVDAEKVQADPVSEETSQEKAEPSQQVSESTPNEAAAPPVEVSVTEQLPVVAEVTEAVPVTETVEKVVDEFENMTIFGNKSLNELHQIQSKKSHLSAGSLFQIS